jgi:hypothetical protein
MGVGTWFGEGLDELLEVEPDESEPGGLDGFLRPKIRFNRPGRSSGSCGGVEAAAAGDLLVPLSVYLLSTGIVGIESFADGKSGSFVRDFARGRLESELFCDLSPPTERSRSEKVSPVFVSFTSDRYDPSDCFSALIIFTCRSGPSRNFRVMTSPALGGPEGASLLACCWATHTPIAVLVPRTLASTHRLQNHFSMAELRSAPTRVNSMTFGGFRACRENRLARIHRLTRSARFKRNSGGRWEEFAGHDISPTTCDTIDSAHLRTGLPRARKTSLPEHCGDTSWI